MVTLENETLSFYGAQDEEGRHRCQMTFQRTLRIPDDHQEYPLPPGLGHFPLFHVEDYADRLPADWGPHGGLFFPMYQAEAMWIHFSSTYPHAVKIGAGKINAVTGKPWTNHLSNEPQDYLVLPNQHWLDGFCIGEGLIRQFVAMPLGEGFTAEEQLTRQAQTGGLQICVYPMKKDYYDQRQEALIWELPAFCRSGAVACDPEMGLAPGGLMRQKIYTDPHGLDAWDDTRMLRCFVHLLNSEQFIQVTDCAPPKRPLSAVDYTAAGFPWFDLYDQDEKAVSGSTTLRQLDSVATRMVKTGTSLADNTSVTPKSTVRLKHKGTVTSGQW